MGYRVETEYPVQGGRLDVVWLTDLPDAVCADALVVVAFEAIQVAFEVEPSSRTRKHVKGDYLNLFDVGAALGVLVLLGDGADALALCGHPATAILRSPSAPVRQVR